jgi:hypothetical protein
MFSEQDLDAMSDEDLIDLLQKAQPGDLGITASRQTKLLREAKTRLAAQKVSDWLHHTDHGVFTA